MGESAIKSERVGVGGIKRRGDEGFGWEEEEGEMSQVSHCHRWQRWGKKGLTCYTFLIVSTIYCSAALSALPRHSLSAVP